MGFGTKGSGLGESICGPQEGCKNSLERGLVRSQGEGEELGSPRQKERVVGRGEDQSVNVVLETFLVYKLLSYNNKDLKEVALIAFGPFIFSCL